MKLADMTAKQIRDWLKGMGHKPVKVNSLKLANPAERMQALRQLHRGKPRKPARYNVHGKRDDNR